MKKILKRRSGEGYIDVCVLVVCAMLVLALVVWSVWEAFHGGDTTLPAFLLGAQVMIFCLVQWIGRARAGDDRVKQEFVLWVILTVALVAFSLLLVLGG